jgi:hypothetical protein
MSEKPICPECNSTDYVVLVNTNQKVGTAFGGAIGFIVTVVRTGITIALGGPGRALAGLLAGAAVGNKVGELIDRNIVCLYKCNRCGKEFEG